MRGPTHLKSLPISLMIVLTVLMANAMLAAGAVTQQRSVPTVNFGRDGTTSNHLASRATVIPCAKPCLNGGVCTPLGTCQCRMGYYTGTYHYTVRAPGSSISLWSSQ